MYSKRHKNMKIGQRKRSYVSKKYNKNRTRNINGVSRYRRHSKTGGASGEVKSPTTKKNDGLIASTIAYFDEKLRNKETDSDGSKYTFEHTKGKFENDMFNGVGKKK